MANTVLDFQISIPSGVASPLVTGDRRLTLHNLVNLLAGGLNAGKLGGLSGAGAYVQATPSIVAATGTVTCATVVNGNTVTIGGTALTATQRRATGTATAATVLENTTLTLNGVVLTAVNGAVVLGEATFDCSGTDTACATSIAAQVNGLASPLLTGVVKARSAAAVVTFYAVTQGTGGNAITLASSDGATLAVSGAVLANGAAITNNTFDFAGTNATTADALAAAINASTTAGIKQVTASSDGVDVVTLTAKFGGVAGNAVTLTSSGATLAVTGSGTLEDGTQGAATRWNL